MDTIRNDIKMAAWKEFKHACEAHPLFHSPHEAVSVMAEEVEEMEEAADAVCDAWADLWHQVRLDCPSEMKPDLEVIYSAAVDTAVEATQVAAMAIKYQLMLDKTGGDLS